MATLNQAVEISLAEEMTFEEHFEGRGIGHVACEGRTF